MFWKQKKRKNYLPFPVDASHREYSMIMSAYDETPPSQNLIHLSLQAIEKARSIDLTDISSRIKTPPYYPNIWPGEHYKLLAAFTSLLQPKYVIEIGTATGLSALCLKKYLPKESKLITFDIVPWDELENAVVTQEDFSDGKLMQYTDNLADPDLFQKYRDYLENASLIFIDATHDGTLEKKLFTLFETLSFKTSPLIILDDIRVWTMLKLWREIAMPKLDLTSFGHWSGTGLVEWQNKKATQTPKLHPFEAALE